MPLFLPDGRSQSDDVLEALRWRAVHARELGYAAVDRRAGYLTAPQIARSLKVPVHWLHDRIHNGTIRVKQHREWKLYLFPDTTKTLAQFRQLRDGQVKQLRF